MIEWLFRKYPRTKKVCIGCGGNYGLVRPHYPYCTREYKEKHYKPPNTQPELPFKPPDKAYDVIG